MSRTPSSRSVNVQGARSLGVRSLAAAGVVAAAVVGLGMAAGPALAADDAGAPAFATTTVTKSGPITGRGTPFHPVTVLNGKGEVVCKATVRAEGAWSCTPANRLHGGTANLKVRDNLTSQASDLTTLQVVCPQPIPVADPAIAAVGSMAIAGASALWIRRRRRSSN